MFTITARDTVELEAMLLRGHSSHDDGIQQVIFPHESNYAGKPRSRHPSKQQVEESFHCLSKYGSYDNTSEEEVDEDEERSVTVNGADIGDLPAEYVVDGLRRNEVPVIGTYVDPKVVPGFTYRVRKVGSNSYLFKGKAMTLVSIGMGYGKRLTFEGETLNHNSNYFYSDTHPRGYAFSLVTAEPQDVFVVRDDVRPVAEARLHEVIDEHELSSQVEEDGAFVKRVAVTFTCSVDYTGDNHGLMPLYSSEMLRLSGQAVIIRSKKARKAFTKYIKHVELKHYGNCTFEA